MYDNGRDGEILPIEKGTINRTNTKSSPYIYYSKWGYIALIYSVAVAVKYLTVKIVLVFCSNTQA